jgi:predicted dinucleotide-binding enzyme
VTADLETRRETRVGPLIKAVSPQRVLRIAVLGAGHVGPVIARAAITAGYQVSIAASGDPENITLITQVLVPGAEPRWAADAVQKSDIVVLAIPLHKFATFDPSLVADKIVVDAMNYWPPIDGVQELFEDRQFGSSEIVARRLSRSTIVKTLNQIGYHDLEDERRAVGSPDRRALGVAGDDTDAVDAVSEVIERIGYDAVRLDSLRAGRVLEPGGPVFGVSLGRAEFEAAVRAKRDGASPPPPLPTTLQTGDLT